MHLLPMASSPDGLISARDAVITKTPGWEVLGGGVLGVGWTQRMHNNHNTQTGGLEVQ